MSIGRSIRQDPLVLPFYLPSLILSLSWGLLVPVLPLFAKDLDASYRAIGGVLAGEAIGMLLGDVPAGLLLRRLGQKRTMLLGTALAAAATTALFWAPSVPVAVALRVVSGLGRAVFGVSRHAFVSTAAKTGARGRAIALFGGLMRIGGFLGPLAGGVIAAACGLRATFLFLGAANLAALATMAVFVPTLPVEELSGNVSPRGQLADALRNRWQALAAAGSGQILAQMIRAGRAAVIPLYAADVVGLDVTQIALIISLSSAVDMSLFPVAGWIMDHWGRKKAIVPSFILQAIGMACVPFAASFAGLLAAAALVALGNGIGSGTMMTLGADLAPSHARGEFLGIWRLIGDAGQSGGPIMVGQIADALTLPMASLAMAAAGLGAALVFWRLVPETLKPCQASELGAAEPKPNG
jgi:MFS family permease